MTFAEIHRKLEELLTVKEWEEVHAEAAELIRDFYHATDKKTVKTEADDDHDAIEEDHIEQIRELIKTYHRKKDEARKNKFDQEKNNQSEKEKILAEITKVISEEENISKAYQKFKVLKENWRNIGNVPFEKQHELQREFSRLSELFYYNMNIYKELRENDLKKNMGSKQEIIDGLKKLAEGEHSLRELETALHKFQHVWEDSGAIPKESWEEKRNEYWEAVKVINDKIHVLREEKKQKQQEYLEAKKTLIEKAKTISSTEKKSARDWDKSTEEILAVQAEWKTIGFAAKEENDKVWNDFRNVCDEFFAAKKEFYSVVKEEYEVNKKKKEEIIAKAEALKDSSDWKETSNALIQLQKNWPKIPSAGKKYDHILWHKFREACDHFFNRKKEHFAAQEVALDENLKKKEAFIAGLSSVNVEGDDDQKILRITELGKEFFAIGDVPLKERDRINALWKEAQEKLYAALNIDPRQKEISLFKSKIASLQNQDNASFALGKERQFIRERINRLTDEINKIENNLGFFGNSKNASELLKDYQQKIDEHKKEVEFLKSKLKLIPRLA